MAANFTNRGIVILYYGQKVTPDIEKAILKVIAPFMYGNKSKADVFQLDSSNLAIAAAGKAINDKSIVIDFTPKVKSPESAAADLIGLTFEEQLKTENPIILATAVSEGINKIAHSAKESDIAFLKALKLVVKPGFQLSVGSETLEKYNLTSQAIQTIRTVLKYKGIPYE